MIGKRRFLVGAMASLAVTVGAAGSLYALSCMEPAEADVWHLELVEVTVDGDRIENLDAYEGYDFRVESPRRWVRFIGDPVDNDDTYSIDFIADAIPQQFEQYSQGQGGEE
jgi:hypothetical protein